MDEGKGNAQSLIEVLVSDDGMIGFVKLNKDPENEPAEITKEMVMAALELEKVVFGIQEDTVEKLVARPIYNLKIKVAEGIAQIDGADGTYECYVAREGEYKPVFDDEEKIDYKNTSHFQLVTEEQVLCTIEKEKKGIEGKNVLGEVIPAKDGRKASIKEGKNTYISDDGTKLISKCDGIVKFIGSSVHVNDMLQIQSDVDILTGNIDFPGDVSINGDVCSGFRVKCGGNLVIKGVIEDAEIESRGNVLVSAGINGGHGKKIKVGKELRSKYIENAIIEVGGDVLADYIIDSQIECGGNISLSGQKELIVGGEIKLKGELRAKDIGTEREHPTKIAIIGVACPDKEALAEYDQKISEKKMELTKLGINEKSVQQMLLDQEKNNISMKKMNREAAEKIAAMLKEINREKDELNKAISKLEEKKKETEMRTPINYFGFVACKRKLYQGVRISFGDEVFHFDSDNLDHCRIYWDNNQIVQGTL